MGGLLNKQLDERNKSNLVKFTLVLTVFLFYLYDYHQFEANKTSNRKRRDDLRNILKYLM